MDYSLTSIIFASALTVGSAMVMYAVSRFKREKRDTETFKRSVELKLHIPPSLHPEIDPQKCMGSLSCLKVCPEGDILGVVNGKAALIAGANCIGHARCALECPVDAIKLVFGTSERGVDLPEIDEHFESSRPGIHIIGELGGMGLIKNAMEQGLQLSQHLAGKRPKAKIADSKQVDVAIVGAGPAGIALALGLREKGLSFRLLDQETLGGTVANYPRQKLVMMDKVALPFIGKFGKSQISKEELISAFQKMLSKIDAKVHAGCKVLAIEGQDGSFRLKTTLGPMTARKVALATGRRGTPRKLGVPGEDLKKVTYRLIDPDQYQKKKVLVVGGGDSALEAAIMLAEQTDAEVSISYRNPAFGRCRPANLEKINHLIEAKRIRALMSSQVKKIDEKSVLMEISGRSSPIENDYVIVCIGGELPLEFLKTVGIDVKKHFGTAPERSRRSPKPSAGLSRITKTENLEEGKRRKRSKVYLWVGLFILACLTSFGWQYYILPPALRVRSPMHALLKPSGGFGHGVGIVATLIMLSNFLYPVRKHWRIFKGRSSIRQWLSFHMFVGFMTPLVILFHAAFQSKNIFATMTFVGLLVVVTTGIMGRFIYNYLPYSEDAELMLSEILSRFEQHKSTLRPILMSAHEVDPIRDFIQWLISPVIDQSFLQAVVTYPKDYLRIRFGLFRTKKLFESKSEYIQFRNELFSILRLRRQISGYRMIHRIVSIWRVFHVVLAIALVILIGIHIYITTNMGYRWIFSK